MSGMQKLLRVIKINALSILAFPLFIVSIVSKLARQALEKILVFIGVGAAIIGLIILKAFIKDPGGFLENLFMFLFLCVFTVAGIVFLFVYLFGRILAALTSSMVLIFSGLLDFIYGICYKGYSSLCEICESDYGELKRSGSKIPVIACVMWHIMRFINFVTIKLLSLSFPLSIAAGVCFLVYAITLISNESQKQYGMSIFEYLKALPALDAVFGVFYFAVPILGIIVILISLGIQWKELGEDLDTDFSESASLVNTPPDSNDNPLDNIFEKGKNVQRCQQYMDTLNELITGFEDLHHQVGMAMKISQDQNLAQMFNEYANLMDILTKQLSSVESDISADIFEKMFIPHIDNAVQLSKQINKEIMRIITLNASSQTEQKTFDFFAGCTTREEIRHRYKALCKVYHPDVGGHEETFKSLQQQYEEKLGAI